ncbi:MAG: hypothetical protein FRX49_07383 [Trebouxia sp. A1-2]|nr:MAG: hypothetical protein FRX49_07383 [Trebouxia sp. A1-2]
MAFVARAPRTAAFGAPPTPQEVGPGSYTVPTQHGSKYPSYVPFSTSTQRGFEMEQSSHEVVPSPIFFHTGAVLLLQYNPGPGEYNWTPSSTSQAQHPSTCFLSNVSRLHERSTASQLQQCRDTPAFTPGPGAYKAPSGFSRRPFRLDGHKQGHKKAKLPVRHTPLPPSVPSKAQSYGYEETPEGQLQAQPHPESTVFTGERNSRVGPGQYDPTVAGVRPQPKAAVFGRGPEINRTAFLLSSSIAPGPGAYTPQEPQSPSKKHRPPEVSNPSATTAIAALQAKLRSSRRAACIEASAVEEVVRASLKHGTVEVSSSNKVVQTESPIGPGYYTNLPTAFDNVLKKPASRVFGGKSIRPGMADPSAGDMPGPGAYGGSLTESWLVASQPSESLAPGFGSSIARWGSSGTSAPGPGAYDQSTLSMQTEVEKRTTNTARHGAFGVGERFAQSKAPDSSAGPGSYSAPSTAPGRARPSPAFQDKQDRFDRPMQTMVPPEKVRRCRGKQGLIFTSAGRLSPGVKGDIVPGPGAYSNAGRDLQHVFKPFTRIKAGFAAGTDRFKSSTKGAAPGPGAYDGVQASTLGKASFNVTYDDHKFNKLL